MLYHCHTDIHSVHYSLVLGPQCRNVEKNSNITFAINKYLETVLLKVLIFKLMTEKSFPNELLSCIGNLSEQYFTLLTSGSALAVIMFKKYLELITNYSQ